jgi:hypothetical protein
MKNNKQKRTKRNIKKKGKGFLTRRLFPRAKIQATKETEEQKAIRLEEKKAIRLALEAILQANQELERQQLQENLMDRKVELQKGQKKLRKSQIKNELERRKTSKITSIRGGKRKKGKKTFKK